MTSTLYIGLISGTSMDAVDCALIDVAGKLPKVLQRLSRPMPLDLKETLLALSRNEHVNLRQLGNADVEVGRLFAATVLELLSRSQVAASSVRAIGSHGQTIWHEPPQDAQGHAFTLQIGDPNTIAELTGITTVADMRRRDMAAGGQGAPIVPALHRELFQSKHCNRIVLNLGGIANITWLPKNSQRALGLDTGPASVLMDGWIQQQRALPYDAAGAWAASASVDEELLELLMEEPYFVRRAPKSTGRELFNLAWLETGLARLGREVPAACVQATLLALSVETICREVEQFASEGEVIVCGGGAHNSAMLQLLAARLPGFKVDTSQAHGIDPDHVEAVAFAWFASRTLAGQPIGFDAFTGAAHPVIAGGIYQVLPQKSAAAAVSRTRTATKPRTKAKAQAKPQATKATSTKAQEKTKVKPKAAARVTAKTKAKTKAKAKTGAPAKAKAGAKANSSSKSRQR